ncbi:MAG: substrate-binding domain-containing protein [Planctomycetota bacterium]
MPDPQKNHPDADSGASKGSIPRILIAFDPGGWKYRGVLRGVNRFAASRGGWQLMILRYHNWPLPVSRAGREAQGVLTDASSDSQALLKDLQCPRVYMTPNRAAQGKPTATHDFRAVGREAFQHLRDRGLGNLAIFTTGEPFRLDAVEIVESFLHRAAESGLEVPVFLRGERTLRRGRWLLDDQIADLADWLRGQPLPLGLLCIDDEHAWRAMEAAGVADLRVPEDVAVLGVGDDECLCESFRPTISSVALNYEQLGYEAAALLASLMDGRARCERVRLAPVGVIERNSTSFLAIDDPLVAQAVTLIRDPAQERVDIDRLVRQLKISRRTLYRRFLKVLGRTPGEEIRRARLESARRWIINTDLKMVAIADRAGFPSVSQMSRDIEKEFGARPTELRSRSKSSRAY